MKKVWITLSTVLFSGCMSTRIQLSPKWDPTVKPAYEDYFDYYLLGLIGKPSLNLQKVCVDQKPYAFKRVISPEDILIAVFTLGIYTPATVKVWCGD